MESASRKPFSRRALIELIVVVVLVVAAPVLVTTQADQVNAPPEEPWIGDWPTLLEHEPDPSTAALHERAAASLARITASDGDVHLEGDL